MKKDSEKKVVSQQALASWEAEGGAQVTAGDARIRLVGTEHQVAWAEKIREHVKADFDRVGAALKTVAARQSGQDLADNVAVLAILEEKRRHVMSNTGAGYFLQTWQETSARVQRLIASDPRFVAIRRARDERRSGEKHSGESTARQATPEPLV